MNWDILPPLVVTAGLTILSWYFVHGLAASRDQKNKRRDLRVEYLLQAYRRLEGCANREHPVPWHADLELAIADVQLLGSRSQITLAQKFSETFARGGGADVDSLLTDLRVDLRKELQLDKVPPTIRYLRIVSARKAASNKPIQPTGPFVHSRLARR
jgi:hypothetical protein